MIVSSLEITLKNKFKPPNSTPFNHFLYFFLYTLKAKCRCQSVDYYYFALTSNFRESKNPSQMILLSNFGFLIWPLDKISPIDKKKAQCNKLKKKATNTIMHACMDPAWCFGGKHKQHGRRQDSRVHVKKKFNKCPQK